MTRVNIYEQYKMMIIIIIIIIIMSSAAVVINTSRVKLTLKSRGDCVSQCASALSDQGLYAQQLVHIIPRT